MLVAQIIATSLLALCVSSGQAADTVYKSVDKDGNVTYSQKPAKGHETLTQELPINPDQNIIPSEKTHEIKSLEKTQKQRSEQEGATSADADQSRKEKVARAQAAVEQAEADLEAGQMARPGDFIRNINGGMRPTLERLNRINALQEAVDAAKENLERVKYDRNSY
jgi:hypothetical protein